GAPNELLSAYASLADRFHNCAPVVDIGCGRGEMLELLAGRGIEAYGIEIDEALVEVVRELGYTVHLADAIAHLESLIDGSLGGIFLGQVIEHLSAQRAADLMALAALKLRTGGRLIIETVN